jgi:hypothetical protein
MMTEEDSTTQTGIIIAAESFAFGFDAEMGEGSGLASDSAGVNYQHPFVAWLPRLDAETNYH